MLGIDYGSCDSFGGNMDVMINRLGKIMGTSEEVLCGMKKDPSIRLQLVDLVKSMPRDGLLPLQSQVISKCSDVSVCFSDNGDLPTSYVLGSCNLPCTDSTSPEYVMSSELYASEKCGEDEGEDEESEESRLIVVAGINHLDDSSNDPCECVIEEKEAEVHCHGDLVSTDDDSPSIDCNSSMPESEDEVGDMCNPENSSDEEMASPQPVTLNENNGSPIATPTYNDIFNEKVKYAYDPSSPFDNDPNDEAYYPFFDEQLDDMINTDHSPAFSFQTSCYNNQSVQVDELSWSLSPYSIVSDSSLGSDDTDGPALVDLVNMGHNTRNKGDSVEDDGDTGPSRRKKLKVEVPHTPLPGTGITSDFLAYPFTGTYTGLLTNCDDETDPIFEADHDGDLPIHVSVAQENLPAVKRCLDLMRGTKIDAVNHAEQTPLHLSCYVESSAIMQCLLQSGANPENVDQDGNNIMHLGCMTGSVQILELLETNFRTQPHKLQAMLSAQNYEGLCPLHEAVKMTIESDDEELRKKGRAVIEYLVHLLNCNLDVKELKGGKTPLMLAIEAQEWDLVDLFVSCGADFNIPSHAESLALDIVALTDNLELAKDLITRGARSGTKNDFSNSDMKALFDNDKRKRRRQGRKRSKAQKIK